jgi:hypothetical protein
MILSPGAPQTIADLGAGPGRVAFALYDDTIRTYVGGANHPAEMTIVQVEAHPKEREAVGRRGEQSLAIQPILRGLAGPSFDCLPLVRLASEVKRCRCCAAWRGT